MLLACACILGAVVGSFVNVCIWRLPAGELTYFAGPEQPPVLRAIARGLSAVLPHLDQLYVADRLSHGQSLPVSFYAIATAYAGAYVAVLLLLSVVIFRRREFV